MNPRPTPRRNDADRDGIAELRARPEARVLIIGAGINGIAAFRDLALQGVDVLLVERDDLASGASAASSHMVHGGIRYLENGEFRLVRESVRERNALLRSAPHLVRPLETTVPIFSTFSGILNAPLRFIRHRSGRPSERGAVLIKIGLTIYDLFSRDGGSVPRHRFRRRRGALLDLPDLDPRVKYTATYFDAAMHHPERLALEVLQDGLRAGPHARVATYVEAVGATADRVVLRDRETGSTLEVRAEVVVNATGPWTDETNAVLGGRTAYMGGTRGSHVVLDHPELLRATRGREIFFEHSDGRIVLIYPLEGRVLVGTTDTDADPDDRGPATSSEFEYFAELVSHVFPGIAIDPSHVVFSFSGVRPLPRHEDTNPGFVSRDYRIETGVVAGVPALSIVGGKWTTFRALGEHVADLVLGLLDAARTVTTRGAAIGGGVGFPVGSERDRWIGEHGARIGTDRAATLLDRYGSAAAQIIDALPLDDRRLEHADGYSVGELALLARHEHVVHLADLILRRTLLAFTGRAGRAALHEVATAVAPVLGWNQDRIAREVAATEAELEARHGVRSEVRSPVTGP